MKINAFYFCCLAFITTSSAFAEPLAASEATCAEFSMGTSLDTVLAKLSPNASADIVALVGGVEMTTKWEVTRCEVANQGDGWNISFTRLSDPEPVSFPANTITSPISTPSTLESFTLYCTYSAGCRKQ